MQLVGIALEGDYQCVGIGKLLGTSGGGHSALLYGHLLKADRAVAFSPYPYLSIKTARQMEDPGLFSMQKQAIRFHRLPDKVKPYFDLKNVLARHNGKTRFDVHVSKFHEWDYKRALYLRGVPGVTIYGHPFEGHGVARMIAEAGRLQNCFSDEGWPDSDFSDQKAMTGT